MKLELYCPQVIYEQGQRQKQEDSIFPLQGDASEANRLFMVCDGLGGMEKGELASATVCHELSRAVMGKLAANDYYLTDAMLHAAVNSTYDLLETADDGKHTRMGTTLTFLCFHRGGCLAAHMGDSRIYHIRPRTGEILYRSVDHSLVQHLYDMGEISYYEMRTSPRRNIIIKAMLTLQEIRSTATVVHIADIQPDDYFYLCSDGMLEAMDDDELTAILQTHVSDEEKARELTARTAQNSDNHSAYLIHIKKVEHEAGDGRLLNDEAYARHCNKALNDPHKDVPWNTINPPLSDDDLEDEPAPAQKKGPKALLKSYLQLLHNFAHALKR